MCQPDPELPRGQRPAAQDSNNGEPFLDSLFPTVCASLKHANS